MRNKQKNLSGYMDCHMVRCYVAMVNNNFSDKMSKFVEMTLMNRTRQ